MNNNKKESSIVSVCRSDKQPPFDSKLQAIHDSILILVRALFTPNKDPHEQFAISDNVDIVNILKSYPGEFRDLIIDTLLSKIYDLHKKNSLKKHILGKKKLGEPFLYAVFAINEMCSVYLPNEYPLNFSKKISVIFGFNEIYLEENHSPLYHLLFIMEKIGKVGDIPYLDFFTKKIHDKRKRAGGISLTELAELKKVTRKTIESIREREEN